MRNLELSEKYGVNPGFQVCFWCRTNINIIMHGRLKNDAKAPWKSILNLKPCNNCIAKMEQGIVLIESVGSEEEAGHPFRLAERSYPTGAWWVISRECLPKILNSPEMAERILKTGQALISPDTARKLGLYDDNEKEVSN